MSQSPSHPQHGASHDGDVAQLIQKGQADLQQQFETFLGGEQGMDAAERQEMARLFQQSMADASTDGSAVAFDRNAWRNTVESLQQASGMSDDDAAQLIRSLNNALDAFESRESQLVLEFTRRIETDGEAAALAWYRSQKAGGTPLSLQAVRTP
ncbi:MULTISPECIES: hypothetical protein [Luteimonas]|uniref:hypothetical protein n=1 Tax=Luteimonas TaxID=83614 RepID=UPI000C7B779A|nr:MULTISPECIES: hypothetical protein [Luteimonas]